VKNRERKLRKISMEVMAEEGICITFHCCTKYLAETT
jgi:hypothetical protein